MGLPWHAISVAVLTIVESATHSEALTPMTEGMIFLSVYLIIG